MSPVDNHSCLVLCSRNSSYKRPRYHWPEIEQMRIKFDRGFEKLGALVEWLECMVAEVKAKKEVRFVYPSSVHTWADQLRS